MDTYQLILLNELEKFKVIFLICRRRGRKGFIQNCCYKEKAYNMNLAFC